MPATLLKKRLWHRCFPLNFAKFQRTPFLTEHFGWLLRNKKSKIDINAAATNLLLYMIPNFIN